jgi:hypothetical protein
MRKHSRRALRWSVLGSVVLGVVALGAYMMPAQAGSGGAEAAAHRSCTRKFDEAQRVDMESFAAYDRETWRAVHHPDATTIFASGTVVTGRDNIVNALRAHFDDREALWTWTEISRLVVGCKTGFILYDATYAIPSIGYKARSLVSVNYTFERGQWLSVSDQSTKHPQPPA